MGLCVFTIQDVVCYQTIFLIVTQIVAAVHSLVAGIMIFLIVIPFSMSSKDMSLINHLPELIELGVDSFKIEGRMKSLHYIATVVSTYRKLIDDYCSDPDNFVLSEKYYLELLKAANRALCTGFYDNQADNSKQLFNQRDEHPTQEFCARVISYDKLLLLIIQWKY